MEFFIVVIITEYHQCRSIDLFLSAESMCLIGRRDKCSHPVQALKTYSIQYARMLGLR